MSKLKIGVIGCGRIALAKHFPAFAKAKDKVDLVAFCDLELGRAIFAAEKYGVPGATTYLDYNELLSDTSIDVVYVLTPNNAHCPITVASLEAGKHVLCEKPMAATSEEAKLMLDTAKRTGKKLTIGYQNRFRKDVQLLKAASADGDLGEVYFAKAHAVRRKAVPTWGVFLDKEKQGGGPLIDIGTHALDITLWTMNNYKPKLVSGSVFHKMKDNYEGNLFGPWDPEKIDVEDSAFGFIKMEDGATIFLESSWALNIQKPREGQVTLCGTKAGAELVGDGAAAPTSAVNGTGTVTFNTAKYGELFDYDPLVISGPGPMDIGGEPFRVADAELAAFVDAIQNDKDPVVTPEQAYVVTQILEAIYKSAATGSVVEF
ncbi:Gfo/Idh/MocA family oxidoreductase [uncultured Tolumonas sp.]|uniref:Gfo/Idh/MocA family protein n=1 Tax=uncultured Tolumonas sp. TaxID=263765 RepID=UPI0029306048|nr:Gfo/Idh/MocA family oxidoreductase [uncultured Tolumonas sp.]